MASLLPPAEVTFADANGVPLAGGTVTFYIPNTTSAKDTWQNSGQSILNSNPITLDSAGRAIIYGSGSYRQVVKDALGNLIWDQITSEPGSGPISYGGTSTGTANAQILSSGTFSNVDGSILSFIAGLSNTSAMTIAVGGSSPITVTKNGTTGPVPLVSGDIVAGNVYSIQYNATTATFQLLQSISGAVQTGAFLAGYLFGLTLSTDAVDAVNDIDIAVGSAASDASIFALMTLPSALVKRIDANWIVGTNQGGLDTGTVTAGNAWYHVYLIQRSDTGVVDVLFSLSANAPTMPTSYDRKRRIGSIFRVAGANVAFFQNGDNFLFSIPFIDVNVNNPGTGAVTRTLSVPTGIVSQAMIDIYASNLSTLVNFTVGVSSLFTTLNTGFAQITSVKNAAGFVTLGSARDNIFTNTSAQVRSYAGSGGGSDLSCNLTIQTLGWIDTRGRI